MSKLKDEIAHLYDNEQINYQAKLHANALLNPNLEWGKWIVRFSLTIGTALFLTGVVFFFAYNWKYLSDFQKFATVETGMLLSFLGYYFTPSNKELLSKLLLMSLCVLMGVFLAVFGQIYQTGADTYQLFIMWALFITGFVMLSEFQGLWFLWVLLINVGIVLWMNLIYLKGQSYFCYLSYLSVLNVILLLTRENIRDIKKWDWLQHPWLRYALLVMILGLQIPGAFIFFTGETFEVMPSGVIYVLSFLGLGYVFQFMLKDIHSVSLLLFSLFIVGEGFLFNILGGSSNRHFDSLFLLMGISSVVLIVLIVKLLKLAKQKMEQEEHE